MDTRHVVESVVSGLAGATALTAVHQALKPRVAGAPRMDVYGRRVVARTLRGVGVEPPAGERLQAAALTMDLASNTLYYAAIGFLAGRHAGRAGGALGVLAGLGAVLLPPVMGLGSKPGSRHKRTILMTIAYYTLGGLVAGAVYRMLRRD